MSLSAVMMLWRYAKWAALLLAVWWIYHQGAVGARQRAELAAARSTIAALETQRKATERALEQSALEARQRASENARMDEQIAAYEDELAQSERVNEDLKQRHDETVTEFKKRLAAASTAPQGKPGCVLTDADVRRLQQLY